MPTSETAEFGFKDLQDLIADCCDDYLTKEDISEEDTLGSLSIESIDLIDLDLRIGMTRERYEALIGENMNTPLGELARRINEAR